MFCKIWSFFLRLFQSAVEAVAWALETIGEVALDLLEGVGAVIGSTIGSVFGGSNLLIWLALGGLGIYFLTKEDSDGDSVTSRYQDAKYAGGQSS